MHLHLTLRKKFFFETANYFLNLGKSCCILKQSKKLSVEFSGTGILQPFPAECDVEQAHTATPLHIHSQIIILSKNVWVQFFGLVLF